jgi:hypothetical protein
MILADDNELLGRLRIYGFHDVVGWILLRDGW